LKRAVFSQDFLFRHKPERTVDFLTSLWFSHFPGDLFSFLWLDFAISHPVLDSTAANLSLLKIFPLRIYPVLSFRSRLETCAPVMIQSPPPAQDLFVPVLVYRMIFQFPLNVRHPTGLISRT
jgi:hypothetical protein